MASFHRVSHRRLAVPRGITSIKNCLSDGSALAYFSYTYGVFPGHNTGLCLASRGGVVIGWRHVEDGTSRRTGLGFPRQPAQGPVNGGPRQPTEG